MKAQLDAALRAAAQERVAREAAESDVARERHAAAALVKTVYATATPPAPATIPTKGANVHARARKIDFGGAVKWLTLSKAAHQKMQLHVDERGSDLLRSERGPVECLDARLPHDVADGWLDPNERKQLRRRLSRVVQVGHAVGEARAQVQ